MGHRYEFTCAGCGYTPAISGGPDFGGACRTVTIVCDTCKELYDEMVSGEPWDTDPVTEMPACPNATVAAHAVRLWEHPGACPKCGAEMARGEIVVCWD